MDNLPESIAREGDDAIVIRWNDGVVTRWAAGQLRDRCPCATCREKKKADRDEQSKPAAAIGLPVLSAAEAQPLRITSMRPVGSYAYNIAFSDGHSSGLFTLEQLRQSDDLPA